MLSTIVAEFTIIVQRIRDGTLYQRLPGVYFYSARSYLLSVARTANELAFRQFIQLHLRSILHLQGLRIARAAYVFKDLIAAIVIVYRGPCNCASRPLQSVPTSNDHRDLAIIVQSESPNPTSTSMIICFLRLPD